MSFSWVIEMNVIHDYIITKKLNLDLGKLLVSSQKMYDLVDKNFNNPFFNGAYADNSNKISLTTKLYNNYNIFFYSFEGLHELYGEIQKMFHDCCIDEEKYYIQAWLNIYKEGQYIDWHNHWIDTENSWHGYFCVECEPSKTTYRIPGVKEEVDIISQNNLLVMSRSAGDTHRTWPWEHADRDRITIAFDILPRIPELNEWPNHWMPI